MLSPRDFVPPGDPMRRRSLPLALILLCAPLVPAVQAEHGTDPVSRKVSRSLREPTLQSTATTALQTSEPWRQGARVHVYVRLTSTEVATLDELRKRILASLDVDVVADRPGITNIRHIDLVEQARRAMRRAVDALAEHHVLPEEFVLADLQQARAALEEITGRRTPDDLLAHIFARFCIGK